MTSIPNGTTQLNPETNQIRSSYCAELPKSAPAHDKGRPLTDRLAIVELIGATTTKTGLKIECALDPRTYEKGIKISDAEMATLNLTGDDFHPEWNYTIKPRNEPDLKRLLCDVR